MSFNPDMDPYFRIVGSNRILTVEDIKLLDRIREQGPWLEELLTVVSSHVLGQRTAVVTNPAAVPQEMDDIDRAQPERWTAIAKIHFQQGLMALQRAITQPDHF